MDLLTFRRRGGLASHRVVAGLLIGVGLASCTDTTVRPERSASVSLSVTVSTGGAPTGPTLGELAYSDGHHLLVLERLTLVVEGVSLREAGVAECGRGEGTAVGCDVLEPGLVLLEAPLDGSVRSFVAALIRPARYDALGLRLHAPNPADPADAAFLALHESFEGTSVRVEGKWDGEPFTFERTLDEEQWLDLRPVAIQAGRTVNVTLRLDPSSWFWAEEGHLVDPRMAATDSAAAAEVETRIRTSIAAFEDHDADGVADSG